MNKFLFNLGENVEIIVSGEKGVVIGRAEFINSSNSYQVRYSGGDGRAVEHWWSEDALSTEGVANAVGGTD